MKIPEIKIEYDLEKEVHQFLRALHNSNLPWLKNLVFETLPDLKNRLNNAIIQDKALEEKIIRDFIVDFRNKHQRKIQDIEEKSQKLLAEKSAVALKELACLMDYQWPENQPDYTVIPTILPNSPFEDNVFYYSILGEIYGDPNSKDVVFWSIHEISHLILFDLLKKDSSAQSLDWVLIYYLKEILAAVLMTQEPLMEIIDAKNYLGNPDLHQIYIYDQTKNKKIPITLFFKDIYEQWRYIKDKQFGDILDCFISIIIEWSDELKEKFAIWNQFGLQTVKNKEILMKYQEPIRFNGKN